MFDIFLKCIQFPRMELISIFWLAQCYSTALSMHWKIHLKNDAGLVAALFFNSSWSQSCFIGEKSGDTTGHCRS